MRNIAFSKFASIATAFLVLLLVGCVGEPEPDHKQNPNLATPIDVVATANSASSITIGWGHVSSADGYHIYQSTSVSGIYTRIATESEITSYTVNNLLPATTYYYRVAAYNQDGTGSQSNIASVTTLSE
ncbi:hypothetical protein R83H12_01606 [Fibrobacteria bacterium R8-3-H12]